MSPSANTFFLVLLASASQIWGHGTITGVTGANGVQATGFGIIESTPRNGILPVPFEQDTSIIRDREIKSGKTGVCGRTPAGGNNDVQSQLTAASNAGLPTASNTGELTMTLHQVNQDGAGPYSCDVSTDGGNTFQAATVTTNVPGFAGLSFSAAKDFPLVMQVPAGTTCTGGPNGDACIARCRNKALAGPFGSCVAFAMGDAAASSNKTQAAASGNKNAAQGDNAAEGDDAAQGDNAAQDDAAQGNDAAQDDAASASAAKSTDSQGGKVGGFFKKIFGNKRETTPSVNKRITNSRIAGRMAGYWIDA